VGEHYPEIPGSVLLRMATLTGAESLGWSEETGSLTPGKSADLAVVSLANADAHDPHQLLFQSDMPVAATAFRGEWVYASAALKDKLTSAAGA
jgi:cytosine/adenosine deaminase-related metal-dependent hydrolase